MPHPLRALLVALAIAVPVSRAVAGGVPACAESSDHTVDVLDLLAILSAWGPCGAGLCQPDLDGSGAVDVVDLLATLAAWGQPCVDAGSFPAAWIDGGNCGTEPEIQIHQYNEHLFILRQSLCTDFEAPFMYLLFGESTVLLQDTGAGGIQIADTVYGIIDQWLADHGRTSIELVVTHSHGHGDHVAGDVQFIGQPNTTVVASSAAAVQAFFGITGWPEQIVEYDLGGRVIDVIPIPGHQSAHIALYDRHAGLLLTGDTLYPGRLYVSAFGAYVDSVKRMVLHVEQAPLAWVLGTHIEMTTTPGVDFPFGSTHHPDEHALQLTFEQLVELKNAATGMADDPQIEIHDDFIIWPL